MTVVSVELRSTAGSGWESRDRWVVSAPQPTNPRHTETMPRTARVGVASVPVRRLGRMRLRPRGTGDRQNRHTDAEMRAGVFAVDDFDGAAVRIHELEHHRKTDAGSLDLHSRGG